MNTLTENKPIDQSNVPPSHSIAKTDIYQLLGTDSNPDSPTTRLSGPGILMGDSGIDNTNITESLSASQPGLQKLIPDPSPVPDPVDELKSAPEQPKQSHVHQPQLSQAKRKHAKDIDFIHEDIKKFYKTFTNLNDKFFIIDKIGEGTFSCVYKAVDLNSDCYDNEWDYMGNDVMRKKLRLAKPDAKSQRNPNLVAIKRVFVTSSPTRIANELTILSRLFGHINVAPLITAMRCQDQVLIILPYFSHVDFRQIYHLSQEIKPYFKQLFRALAFVHSKGIIHRDVKPQNFLYDVSRQHGVLVDFGLAEYAPRSQNCVCNNGVGRQREFENVRPQGGYPKNDTRPGRRSNRAGTRGFRAPEVLFKCCDQSTKIDIWSAGVMLLCYLTRTFPFFNSITDVDALLEIASILGRRKMEACALLHGVVFETNISTLPTRSYPWLSIVEWQLKAKLSDEQREAVEFMHHVLKPNPSERLTAQAAINSTWLANVNLPYEEK